jgi:hypothetical protein
MSDYRRSEQEELFEQLCQEVDADEAHEQEAIDHFERHMDDDEFDAARYLDIALYYSVAVARGIIELVNDEDRARCNIAELIADSLDVSYSEAECEKFAEALQVALTNGVPIDLDIVLDGCQRALDDMEQWADDEDREPLLRLRDELIRLKDDEA